ncbi:MAG: DUF2279 domain-containing protein, partial [Bacteroidota bacterium]
WYEDDRSRFRFFNDNHEWRQMDKFGHFYSSYHLGRLGYDLLKPNPNLSENTKLWLGGGLGFALLLPIEILDGFAPEYGASWGDLGANALGSFTFIAQQKWVGKPLVQPKFFFWQTRWASQRPELLGYNFSEELLKDYNGQTYWLSFDLRGITQKRGIPKWLNLAVGYGAEQMVYGSESENRTNGFRSYRQYYLAPDLDFSHVRSRSGVVNGLLWFLRMVKIPTPGLRMDRKGLSVGVF